MKEDIHIANIGKKSIVITSDTLAHKYNLFTIGQRITGDHLQ